MRLLMRMVYKVMYYIFTELLMRIVYKVIYYIFTKLKEGHTTEINAISAKVYL